MLGQGAFGSVWKARDTKLNRIVAIKVPRRGQFLPDDVERFLREAQAPAELHHPNIVTVFEVGQDGDLAYIVSEFIEGQPLDKWLVAQGRRLTDREAAELCVTIAHALHYAHEHGVIHRDLKPSNIMLDAASQPHLLDFGLAKREAGEITMTVEGQILGTPASPERRISLAASWGLRGCPPKRLRRKPALDRPSLGLGVCFQLAPAVPACLVSEPFSFTIMMSRRQGKLDVSFHPMTP